MCCRIEYCQCLAGTGYPVRTTKAAQHGLDVIDVDIVLLVPEEAAVIEDGDALGGGTLTAAVN